MSEFITGCCRLISGIFGAVYSEPALAFFMTVILVLACCLMIWVITRLLRWLFPQRFGPKAKPAKKPKKVKKVVRVEDDEDEEEDV